jgi:uncharacterized protein YcfJ
LKNEDKVGKIMLRKTFSGFLALAFISTSIDASAQEVIQRAKIISVTPVTEEVLVIKSNCNDDSINASNQQSVFNSNTVIGAIIGGLLGRTVGSGTGKTVATIGGAVAGGVIANAMQQVPADKKYQNIPNPCRNIKTYEPVPGGFEIVYELNGKQYSSMSNTYPTGEFIEVKMAPSIVETK